jgi:hypothetical protein
MQIIQRMGLFLKNLPSCTPVRDSAEAWNLQNGYSGRGRRQCGAVAHRLQIIGEKMNRVQIHLNRMTCGGSGIEQGDIEAKPFFSSCSVYRAAYLEPREPAGYAEPIWPRAVSGWGNQAFKMRGPNPSLNWRNI